MPATYRLDTSAAAPPTVPTLDAAQRRVVEHAGGPLLVLAGPGTGKTTTLVEAVVDRVERRGEDLEHVLVLTFSRRAAAELRDRITSRLGRTTTTPVASTFHAFCYSLVRRFQPAELYSAPLRLLSAPEHDVMLRELLVDRSDDAAVQWPAELQPAVRTRAFAGEVRAVLARAREMGLDPDELAAAGQSVGRPEWAAATAFLRQYLDVLDSSSSLDYAELVHRAVVLCGTPGLREELRRQYRVVFVDEYQDSDASQVRLLQSLAGDGRDLVVVGDPDQSIYAFRGADVRGILQFPDDFRSAAGRRADVVALQTTRRFGPELLASSRSVAAGIGARGAIDREVFARFRAPTAAPGPHGAGTVEVFTFGSAGSEAAAIGDLVRRAHLEDGVPWSQVAVLVRSGVTLLPFLRRVLVSAGVPVEVAGEDIPLHCEPAVAPLLTALECAVDSAALTVDAARALLLSPLASLDAADLRRLGRELRLRDRGPQGDRLPRPSRDLLREALADPQVLDGIGGRAASRARRLGRLLAAASAELAAGAVAEDALWSLWDGTSWRHRLRAAVEQGGAGARAAHRDLDAVCALFDLAARAEERRQRAGARTFLAEVRAQQIPGESLSAGSSERDAVQLMTAHRAKGLEWRVVVVAGVQEGSWPDLRRRGSLLGADQLSSAGEVLPHSTAAMLAEERRLFYVAVTRARSRLVVTAVASSDPAGDQPSRFLETLGVGVQHRAGRPGRPLSVAALVGELRRIAAHPDTDARLRDAAVARLGRLADSRVAGSPLTGFADPGAWWGSRERTHSDAPLRAEDQPLRLTASTVAAINDCPLRWFLSRQAAGEAGRSAALGFGSVIHVLAESVAGRGPVEADELIERLDSVWDQLHFDSPWIARRERGEAEQMLRRFARWHNERPQRSAVAAEVPFEVHTVDRSGDDVVLTGAVDRLERDATGEVMVIDFKTGKQVPSRQQVQSDLQLGFYQLAASAGAFASACGEEVRCGGAELVHLRTASEGFPEVRVQPRADDDLDDTVQTALTAAVGVLRREEFAATGNPHCSRCPFVRTCPASGRPKALLS